MDLSGLMSYLVSFIITATIYAIFALGLNVQWGYTGLFNIGLAGFFAVGAYTSALLTMPPPETEFVQHIAGFGLPFVVGLIGAGAVSGLVAFLIGIPTLKLREDYLAITTIGIAETIRLVLNNERWLANGSRGLVGIPQPLRQLLSPENYNYLYVIIAGIVLVVVFLAIERVIHSPWGRVLKAIREDEITTAVSGKNIFSFKMQSFVLGSVILGIGGAVYAHYIAALSPETF
ncbi:MAG: ABC transporter permease, partial [Chloroflexi bacterium RBG_13_54_9]